MSEINNKQLDDLIKDISESSKKINYESVLDEPTKYIKKSDFNIKNLDEVYLQGKVDSKDLLDEHLFMGKLDCKSRLNYCFTNKELSQKCFDKNDILHITYILPCKMRTELKKIINFINNQDIEKYKDSIGFPSEYLNKAVHIHFNRVLPLFNFNEKEITSLAESGRDYDEKKNIFSSSIESEGGRGMYFEYLLKSFNKDNKLLQDIIDKYIDILIINFKYNEVEAIDSAFKFLNTLVVGSESFNSIEKYYLEQFRKFKAEQRKLLYSSESE